MLLRAHITGNHLDDRVSTNRCAVAGRRGNVDLYISETNTGGHSTVISRGKCIEVPCVTLVDVLADNQIAKCDLLKIDVEGAEYDILYSASNNTLQKIKNIVVEFHDIEGDPSQCGSALEAYLSRSGYSVRKVPPYLYCSRDAL
jgi:FkbM family methyltransferase